MHVCVHLIQSLNGSGSPTARAARLRTGGDGAAGVPVGVRLR